VLAEAARRAGEWATVRDRAREALGAIPTNESASALALRADFELNLPRAVVAPAGIALQLVPAAEFTMGSSDGEPDERPARRVYLDSFYIGRTEVTNQQYGQFRPEHVTKWWRYSPDPEMPVVCVRWPDAVEFCRWLSARDGLTYRLPTEAEWEKAARGIDGRIYPWGNDPPDAATGPRCNCRLGAAEENAAAGLVPLLLPVGSHPSGVSPFNVHDMAGNVWEWVADWYAEQPASSSADASRGPVDGTKRVMRGGAFNTGVGTIRCANRAAHVPAFGNANVGFRVARSVARPQVTEVGRTGEP
jgi:formylglycine-generating enzyme required for sulfatase activity